MENGTKKNIFSFQFESLLLHITIHRVYFYTQTISFNWRAVGAPIDFLSCVVSAINYTIILIFIHGSAQTGRKTVSSVESTQNPLVILFEMFIQRKIFMRNYCDVLPFVDNE